MIRHGDVLLRSAADVDMDDGFAIIQRGCVILAEGEVTGHAHVVSGEVALLEHEGRRLLFVEAPAELTHQEHDTIVISPGIYWVVMQREYTPQEVRRVQD